MPLKPWFWHTPRPLHSGSLHGTQASCVQLFPSLHWVVALFGVQSTQHLPAVQVPLPEPIMHGVLSSTALFEGTPLLQVSSVHCSSSFGTSPLSICFVASPPLQTMR